ncbi:MAG: hypothetical protein KF774_01850 [Planctomyces sp.]|nr:hypothetical protein [Planctomyces sp.]
MNVMKISSMVAAVALGLGVTSTSHAQVGYSYPAFGTPAYAPAVRPAAYPSTIPCANGVCPMPSMGSYNLPAGYGYTNGQCQTICGPNGCQTVCPPQSNPYPGSYPQAPVNRPLQNVPAGGIPTLNLDQVPWSQPVNWQPQTLPLQQQPMHPQPGYDWNQSAPWQAPVQWNQPSPWSASPLPAQGGRTRGGFPTDAENTFGNGVRLN